MPPSNKFDKLKISLRYWLSGKEFYKALEAMEFAARYHTGIRKDGVTPEFHHQISIAHYLRTLPNLRNPQVALTTAFLHDVVEDYDVSIGDIRDRFGAEVADAVNLLSKSVSGRKKNISDYYEMMAESPIASIVKGGDRIHNFQTMYCAFSPEKQQKYIEECEQHILPMLKEARRLYPDQELAYENIKHILCSQIELIEATLRVNEKS
jgi:(p)ppGpp synthase/HD superfamily hydrolase